MPFGITFNRKKENKKAATIDFTNDRKKERNEVRISRPILLSSTMADLDKKIPDPLNDAAPVAAAGTRGSLLPRTSHSTQRFSISDPDKIEPQIVSPKIRKFNTYRKSPRLSPKRTHRNYSKTVKSYRDSGIKTPELRFPNMELNYSSDSLPEVSKKASIESMDFLNVYITPENSPKVALKEIPVTNEKESKRRTIIFNLRVSTSEDKILQELPITRKDRSKISHSVKLPSVNIREAISRSKSLPSISTWENLDDVVGPVDSLIFKKEHDPLMNDCNQLNEEKEVAVKPFRRGYLMRKGEKVWGVLTATSLKLYPKKLATVAKEIIPLTMATVRAKKNSSHRFEILQYNQSKGITLGASKESTNLWINEIQEAINELGENEEIKSCSSEEVPETLVKTIYRKPSDPLLKDFIQLLEVPHLPDRLKRSLQKSTSHLQSPPVKRIDYDEKTLIAKSGNLEGILDLMTSSEYCKRDPNFGNVIIFTFRYFIGTTQMMDYLIKKFTTSPIHLHKSVIINLLCSWIQFSVNDFLTDQELMRGLSKFMGELTNVEEDYYLQQLSETLKQYTTNPGSSTLEKKAIFRRTLSILKPIEFERSFDFLEFSEKELAEQLTLLEHEIFLSIPLSQCFDQKWNLPNAEELAPSILNYTHRFNKMTYMVCTEIVLAPSHAQRVTIIKRYIMVAKKCYSMNNFNSSMEIICGLNLAAVQKLKTAWKAVPKKYIVVMENLTKVYTPDNNYKNYREIVKTKSLPINPYLALTLRDLSLIELHNKTKIGNSLINLEKLRLVSSILMPLKKMQETPYPFVKNHAIQRWLSKYQVLDEEELYKLASMTESTRKLTLV